MTPQRAAAAAAETALIVSLLFTAAVAIGSPSTLAIAHVTGTVCGVTAGAAPRGVRCVRLQDQQPSFGLLPNFTFVSVSGGQRFLCGLRSPGTSFFCWDTAGGSNTSLSVKRVYRGSDVLTGLVVGDDQIAALGSNPTGIRWWRGSRSYPSFVAGEFKSLTSGRGFTCAVAAGGGVLCWGPRGGAMQRAFENVSMTSIVAGDSHACGVDGGGVLVCRGSNDSYQSDPPAGEEFEFSGLALGAGHSCAVKNSDGAVVCWGGGVRGSFNPVAGKSLVAVVSGGNLTCGITTANFSVVCWPAGSRNPAVITLSLPQILPGICVDPSSCTCGPFPDSADLCSGSGSVVICKPSPCNTNLRSPRLPAPLPSPPANSTPLASPPAKTSKTMLAFLIVGSVGAAAGICTMAYCIWACLCGQKKIHNSVQPTVAGGNRRGSSAASTDVSPHSSPLESRSRTVRRQRSWARKVRRQQQRGSHRGAEEFTFETLSAATAGFSQETMLGEGSFGAVYRGKLQDGREVAIKRSETGPKTKKLQEKETAFRSELGFLSRLHHRHLVGFVGYCAEREERLLVYEFMKNGALYDHLHSSAHASGSSSWSASPSPVVSSWRMRIKILLDAARGIEYLHRYAVPAIIHRDIKSSNILLDESWTAKVSDFGLSLLEPDWEGETATARAAGTVGYMDPEYYGLHHLTVKSDVYGLGVVMLEVVTGRKAIFRDDTIASGKPTSVVDYAVPAIIAGDMGRVADGRAPLTAPAVEEAVELLAYTAMRCVNLEGRERPTVTDVASNLENALSLCDELPAPAGSFSSATLSIASE